jgi:predicted RNase H-like HicB family nuclease
MMKYAVIYERAKDRSTWGYALDIPGATGAGDTLEEARESVATGIALWIETLASEASRFPSRA